MSHFTDVRMFFFCGSCSFSTGVKEEFEFSIFAKTEQESNSRIFYLANKY